MTLSGPTARIVLSCVLPRTRQKQLQDFSSTLLSNLMPMNIIPYWSSLLANWRKCKNTDLFSDRMTQSPTLSIGCIRYVEASIGSYRNARKCVGGISLSFTEYQATRSATKAINTSNMTFGKPKWRHEILKAPRMFSRLWLHSLQQNSTFEPWVSSCPRHIEMVRLQCFMYVSLLPVWTVTEIYNFRQQWLQTKCLQKSQ